MKGSSRTKKVHIYLREEKEKAGRAQIYLRSIEHWFLQASSLCIFWHPLLPRRSKVPILEGSLENLTDGLHTMELCTLPSVKIFWDTWIRFPGRIEQVQAIINLIHRACAILVNFNIVCISPKCTSVAAFVELHRNGLGATQLPCAKVGLIYFFAHMWALRYTHFIGKIPSQKNTHEFVPKVSSFFCFIGFFFKKSITWFELRVVSSQHYQPLSSKSFGTISEESQLLFN